MKEKIYCIHAYDATFGGLHGMEEFDIDYFPSEKEAFSRATEMSWSVIEDYDVKEQIIDEDWEYVLSEEEITQILMEDIDYVVYELTDPAMIKLFSVDKDKVFDMFMDDEDDFVEKYCKIL